MIARRVKDTNEIIGIGTEEGIRTPALADPRLDSFGCFPEGGAKLLIEYLATKTLDTRGLRTCPGIFGERFAVFPDDVQDHTETVQVNLGGAPKHLVVIGHELRRHVAECTDRTMGADARFRVLVVDGGKGIRTATTHHIQKGAWRLIRGKVA